MTKRAAGIDKKKTSHSRKTKKQPVIKCDMLKKRANKKHIHK